MVTLRRTRSSWGVLLCLSDMMQYFQFPFSPSCLRNRQSFLPLTPCSHALPCVLRPQSPCFVSPQSHSFLLSSPRLKTQICEIILRFSQRFSQCKQGIIHTFHRQMPTVRRILELPLLHVVSVAFGLSPSSVSTHTRTLHFD